MDLSLDVFIVFESLFLKGSTGPIRLLGQYENLCLVSTVSETLQCPAGRVSNEGRSSMKAREHLQKRKIVDSDSDDDYDPTGPSQPPKACSLLSTASTEDPPPPPNLPTHHNGCR